MEMTREFGMISKMCEVIYDTYGVSIFLKYKGNYLIQLGDPLDEDALSSREYEFGKYQIKKLDKFKFCIHPAGKMWCYMEEPKEGATIAIGPVWIKNITPSIAFFNNKHEKMISVEARQFVDIYRMIYRVFFDEPIATSPDVIVQELIGVFSNDLFVPLFSEITTETLQQQYDRLWLRLELIKNGDVVSLDELNTCPKEKNDLNEICTSELLTRRILRFSLHLAMYYSVKGGLSLEKAAALEGYYENLICSLKSKEEAITTYSNMLKHFAVNTAESKLIGLSKNVYAAIAFIRENMNRKLKINDISAEVGLSPSYFLQLFQKEMGMTVGSFIKKEKIIHAKFLLSYTQYPIS